MKGDRFWMALAAVLCFLCASILTPSAVVFYSTADPHYNTTAPAGSLAGSGWDLQGESSPGVPIAPNFFIPATHVSARVGNTFRFHGLNYPVTATFAHPDADLTICRVEGTFPQYATLYNSGDEVGKSLVVFGRGAQRGDEVRMNGVLKGWAWGKPDGILRWGENVVSGISDPDGNPATAETKFQLLKADFDTAGGPNEAHLSGGDSGGSVFIQDGDIWKLAGINHAANQDYGYGVDDEGFNATLFDEVGFFEGEKGEREYHPEKPSVQQPGSFYATRISVYAGWIQSVIASSSSEISLEEAPSLFGPYTRASGALIDTNAKTIMIPEPTGTRFYRVVGDRSYVIHGVSKAGEQFALFYQ